MANGFARNAFLSTLAWAVPIAAAVVAVPITLRGLGEEAYGVLVLVGATTGYLAVMELGLANGIIRYLSVFVSRGYGAAIRGCIRVVLYWFIGVGLLGALMTWFLAPWLVGTALRVPTHLTSDAIVAFRVGGVTFALGMLASPLSLIPQAFLRYDLVAAAGGGLSLAGVIAPAILVSLGYGLVPVMVCGAALALAGCVIWIVVGQHLVSSVPAQGPLFREYRREFAGFAIATAANKVWSAVALQTSRVVIGVAGGSAQVAYYQVPSLISTNVNGLLNRVSTVLLPTGAHLAARGEREQILALYLRSSRLLYVVNAACSGAIIVMSAPLLRFWVGPQYASAGWIVLSLLTLAQLFNASSMSASNLNLSLGRPKVNLFFAVANSIVNLLLMYVLTVRYGIAGTAFSGVLGAATTPMFLWYSHRHVLMVGSWRVVRDCYLPTTIGVCIVCAVSWFTIKGLATGLPSSIALTAVVAALCVVASWALGAVDAADIASARGALKRSGPQVPEVQHADETRAWHE